MKSDQLSRTSLIWQILAIVLPVLPHLTHLPLWVPVLLLLCMGWRIMVFIGRWSFPAWYVRSALVVLSAIGVVVSYKMGSGISSTVALLVTGFGLKALEMYKKRDALVVIYVAYLVSATSFLFDQSILMAIYVFAVISVCTTALLSLNLIKDINFWVPLKRTVLLVLPAIPLMLVLFVMVPRIGPLWEMGLDQSAAKTGLSEQMSPGDITKLTRSAETAFRVKFRGGPPGQSDLYWRAIVLNDFDGRTWYNEMPLNRGLRGGTTRAPVNTLLEYEVIMEASERKYIPVLEQLAAVPAGYSVNADLTLAVPDVLKQRSQLLLQSRLTDHYQNGDNLFQFQRQLILPDGNLRAKQQAGRWWQETQDIRAYLDKILNHYNQSFVYTLQPPALGVNPIDEFLFTTRRGFCGHFSSTTAFMLRAVGIPARVVTGYQGGEWNPYEDYLLVRQYDAHAWVEYWTEETGWTRIDPTAYVAPERIEQPSDQTLGREQKFLADNPFFSAAILNKGWLATIRLRMEALNYGWHRWVLGYHNQQQAFLSQLIGNITVFKLVLFLLIPFAVVIVATTLMIIRSNSAPDPDPSDRLISLLSERLGKQGLQRQRGETVQNYCRRIGEIRQELSEPLLQIGSLYEQLRYAGIADNAALQELSVLVNRCCRKA